MSSQARWEYMKSVHTRYAEAKTKSDKGRILDEFCKTYRCHRKHALRLLNAPPPPERRPIRRRKPSKYDPRLVTILESVWAASGYLWSQRLKAAIPLWLPWIRRKHAMIPQLEQHIPIKTDCWNVDRPGFVEIDLVSHAGKAALGDFAHTLDMTDIFSGWVERRCVLGKGQEAIRAALDDIRQQLPFELLAIDSDNGSEFINHHLLKYCQTEPTIQFTRGRPYKKDDNAHVEQKNWTHVRKLIGYGRFDSQGPISAINDLYRNELRWFQNLFQPSVKLIRKHRIGSRLTRRYDAPQTPLQRLAKSRHVDARRLKPFEEMVSRLDPFALSCGVDRKLTKIHSLANQSTIKGQTNRWVMPALKQPRNGPDLETAPASALNRYENLFRKEVSLQTW
jgi:hypothetical protein